MVVHSPRKNILGPGFTHPLLSHLFVNMVNKRLKNRTTGFQNVDYLVFSSDVWMYWPEEKIPDKTGCFQEVNFNFAYITPNCQMNKSCVRIYLPFGKHMVIQSPAPQKMIKYTILWAWLRAFIFSQVKEMERETDTFFKRKCELGGNISVT